MSRKEKELLVEMLRMIFERSNPDWSDWVNFSNISKEFVRQSEEEQIP